MKRPSIKTALIIAFSASSIMTGALAAYSISSLSFTNSQVREIAQDWLPSVSLMKEADVAISDLRVAFRDHVLAVDDQTEAAAKAAIEREHERLLKTLDQYETLVTEDSEKKMLADIRARVSDYMQFGNAMVTASSQQKDEEAKQILAQKMRPASVAISETIDQLVTINTEGADHAFADSQSAFSVTLWVIGIIIGLCAIVAVAAIWFAISGVAAPIRAITGSMKSLADGDKQSDIPFGGRADEIGDMAAAVEVFRQNALTNERLENETVAQRKTVEDQRQLTQKVDAQRAAEMAQATASLGEGLKRLSSGDLAYRLNTPFAQDFEGLRNDFNAAVKQLADTIKDVAAAASQIDSGTLEISQSANDLSKRTEQQAASLEETAAALDEITANVTNASKRADEARAAAIDANSSAELSGQVMANAVEAMHKIEKSSSEIANIIVVIDEIAFQTNLLALNAGVEAARAGDAGKGFAVVAQEVRELAQRSAKAAKEIKDLIGNSSTQVSSGVKLVSETGEALGTIRSHIVMINQHMEAIATSAKEQSVGLSEVNTAVNQMDQVTQQNAAMVEESNAASATLATEAARLRDLVGRFELGQSTQGTSRQTPYLREVRNTERPAPSPVHRAVGKVAAAFGAKPSKPDSWEEF
jgi:methyl-accepting chemotaxis protein